MKKKLILIGAGGYAKSVIDSIDIEKYHIYGFIDDIKGGTHLGYPILANSLDKIIDKQEFCYFVSIGDNNKRTFWYNELSKKNLEIINVIDKTAILSKNIPYGHGLFVGKAAIINSDVRIGENVIINTKALIEHGGIIGHNSNISTNATLNGDVEIGMGCFIGSSSVINGQIKIGNRATVGAGAVVIKDVEENTTVVGIPAKEIKRKDETLNE